MRNNYRLMQFPRFIALSLPHSRIMRFPNVEAGSKIFKECCRKSFSKYFIILVRRWNVKNADSSQGNLFSNEVDIDLNVFCAVSVDRVMCHVDRADVVTIDENGFLWRRVHLKK